MPADDAPSKPLTGSNGAEKALIDSFHAFVREELKKLPSGDAQQKPSNDQQKKESHDLGVIQVVVLIAFALDIALAYMALIDLRPGIAENKLWGFIEKLMPVLGGSLLVSYFDRLRGWFLTHSTKRSLWIPLMASLFVLLVTQVPIYSAFVRVDPSPSSVDIQVDEKDTGFDESGSFVPDLKLRPHKVRVLLRDNSVGSNPWFEYQIGSSSVLKGTVVRLLRLVLSEHYFAEHFHFTARPLAAAYPVTIDCRPEKGQLYISGSALPLWQPDPKYLNSRLKQVKNAPKEACPTSDNCWEENIMSIGDVALPAGDYTFAQVNGNCILRTTNTKKIDKRQQLVLGKQRPDVWASPGCK